MLGEKQSILKTIIRRKRNWIGHMIREESLLREVMEGRIEGNLPVGRALKR